MRADTTGFFWDDFVPPKVTAVKEKRTPPERTWEAPDYLPNLAEALVFEPLLIEDEELLAAAQNGERFVFDIECYPNYFLIAFSSLVSGKVLVFELAENKNLHIEKLRWVLENLCLVSFNGNTYDMPIASMAVAGKSTVQMFAATEAIILHGERSYDVLKHYRVKQLKANHIDLIEVAPLRASLKIYAGRLHCKRMQDLPFVPGTNLTENQIAIVRWYCCNDLDNTALLYHELEDQIQLRERLGQEYGVDLRSRSDAQIAEAVIAHEVEKLNGVKPTRPVFPPGMRFKYKVPNFISYTSAEMKWVLNLVRQVDFVISDNGEVGMPEELKNLCIPLGSGMYRMGIGGLHSSEKKTAHIADAQTLIIDRDVASYYPSIILNQGLYPQHLGLNFLQVYRQLVARRLHAKNTGDKVTADSIKITINGGFGKLGSPYSILYSPHLLIQVTITGQLSLLMLIERLEANDIPVVSANTDGVIIKCPLAKKKALDTVIGTWEKDTNFATEETRYKAVYSRDVNNYVAIKLDGGSPKKRYLDEQLGCKAKGAYCERGSAGNSVLSKNPSALICSDAALSYLALGKSIEETVRACQDVTRFVVVRSVTGGAVKDGQYLGKSIRWYYAKDEQGEIVYANSGNKVPRSESAKPLMLLPDVLPQDIDFEWYEKEAYKILKELSCQD